MKQNKKNFNEQNKYDYVHSNKSLNYKEKHELRRKFDNDNFGFKQDAKQYKSKKKDLFLDEQEEELKSLSYVGNFKF